MIGSFEGCVCSLWAFLSHLKPLLDVLTGLLTPCIAVVTIYIACQQHKIEKNKFKLALYEKRYAFYLTVMEYISQIVQAGDASNEEIMQFLRNTKETFLFNDEIKKLCEQVYHQSNELHYLEKSINTTGDNQKLVEKRGAIFDWFVKQLASAPKVFERYLRVKD
jgi:hypothetical protein